MRPSIRTTLSSLLLLASSYASAGVISQDGVVFTSTFTGNVLTLEIDAARRSGAWAAATAIDALALKTIGSFSGVQMSSSTGAAWSLSASELKAKGCASASSGSGAGQKLLCVSGAGVALTDNMVFTFTFDGTPSLAAPHLKVHFVNANGSKAGSLLSMDFPAQAATAPAPAPVAAPAPAPAPAPVVDTASGSGGGASTVTVPVTLPIALELIPQPVLTETGKDALASDIDLPLSTGATGGTSASEVPEPQSIVIIGAGLALMGLTRRKRRPAA